MRLMFAKGRHFRRSGRAVFHTVLLETDHDGMHRSLQHSYASRAHAGDVRAIWALSQTACRRRVQHYDSDVDFGGTESQMADASYCEPERLCSNNSLFKYLFNSCACFQHAAFKYR